MRLFYSTGSKILTEKGFKIAKRFCFQKIIASYHFLIRYKEKNHVKGTFIKYHD